MKRITGRPLAKAVLLILSGVMLAVLTVPSAAGAQDYYYINAPKTNPCPHFSIQDVFDDPNGDWDHDHVTNSVELYNGLKPCVADSSTFCASQPTLCTVTHNHTSTCASGHWTWNGVNANPNGDWDNDGVSNRTEALNGANPCDHPCPNWTATDVALNPNGSWDNDGISNAVEAWQGTNPCSGHYYHNPCPHWTAKDVHSMPGHDWDGDGVSNRNEVKQGTNPCVKDVYVVVYPTPKPKPHHNTPPPGYKCPVGYPYYHSGTGLCYVHPVGGY